MLAGSASKVILVCNEPPEGLPSNDRLIVKPIVSRMPRTHYEMMEDKYFKLKIALMLAREFAPAWLMRADADDLISQRLVPFVERQPPDTAWYSEIGWAHRFGSPWVIRMHDFHMICGTSCITHVAPHDLPTSLDEPASDYYLLTQGHNIVVEFLRKSGVLTNPVPFPTTLYVTDSGENSSGPWLTKLGSRRVRLRFVLNSRPITRSLREEFGLYPTMMCNNSSQV